jgi:5-methylcytosine-specific restriction enzyme A
MILSLTAYQILRSCHLPMAPKHPCAEPRCPNLVERGTSRCPDHARAYDLQRGSAKDRGYDSRWNRASRRFRHRWPLCGMKADGTLDTENSWCAAEGRTTLAQCVQHIQPHQGPDDPLFMRESNWLSSCFKCNNKRRALREPGAFGRR